MSARRDDWADHLGELLRLLDRSDVEELEVEHDGARLVIRRDLHAAASAPAIAAPSPPARQRPESFVVASPIVGIFRQVTAGADPPVEVGATVEAGQVIGSVEAMRMLSRVQSERGGVVHEILIEDGQPVEYGQPLVVLRVS